MPARMPIPRRRKMMKPEKDVKSRIDEVTDGSSQINLVVNSPFDEDTISLANVFHNFAVKGRLYIWVLALFVVVGASVPLVLYQFTKTPLTVTSVVTLNYDDANNNPVTTLTAPDGTELDLTQVTSAYVLQNALSGISLSHSITIESLRNNIKISRILTENSRRQQEIVEDMIANKNTAAYSQAKELKLEYENRFVISLTNGFTDAQTGKDIELEDGELSSVLDCVIASYNNYLYNTYADLKLPDNEISAIDTDKLDVLESLDMLRTDMKNLYNYCAEKPDAVKAYRSYRTGHSLEDLMESLRTVQIVNVDYLYSYVYASSATKDRAAMLTSYRYQLRNEQIKIDAINENIATTQQILDTYKNDQISVSSQDSDTVKSTKTTTEYYNNLVIAQAENYAKAAELEIRVEDLKSKIASLEKNEEAAAVSEAVKAELLQVIEACSDTYRLVYDHMDELTKSAFYTSFLEHTASAGESKNFITANTKKLIIGVAAGGVIALFMWFIAALAPEFKTDEKKKEAKA